MGNGVEAMEETFENWRSSVYERLREKRPDVTSGGVSHDAMRHAFEAGVSVEEFCSLPAREIMPFTESDLGERAHEFRNSRTLCFGNAVLFFAGSAAMVAASVLMRGGAFGKQSPAAWVIVGTLAALSAVIGFTYLALLRPHWYLHSDRLECRGITGKTTTILKDDVVSFSKIAATQSYVLKDHRSSIYVGRPMGEWQKLHDVLNGWAANDPGV